MDLDSIDSAYSAIECAASTGWEISEVAWPTYGAFHKSLKAFEAAVVGHDLLETWGPRLGYCKRYRYFLATTLFSPAAMIGEMRRWKLKAGPDVSQLLAGSAATVQAAYKAVEDRFRVLAAEEENPLWKAARQDVHERGGGLVAVLYNDARLSEPLRKLLEAQATDELQFWPVRPTELKRPEVYDQLIVFGPTQRHQRDGTDFVFKCPRAMVTTLFTPAVFPTSIPSAYELLGSPHKRSRSPASRSISAYAKPVIKKVGETSTLEVEGFAAAGDEWLNALPVLNFTGAYNPSVGQPEDGDQEPVAAQQVLLSGDHGVMLPSAGGAYRIVERWDDGTECFVCEDIEHVDVAEVASGDIILFSTGGGGDMVAEVADTLMAERKDWARGCQMGWKSALREKMSAHGYSDVVFLLKRAGSTLASIPNVRNWGSMVNIGPGSRSDFEAILNLCGLPNKDEFFAATDFIREAHRKAGFQLAGKLLQLIQGRPLSELHTTGVQRFGKTPHLPNEKTAFVVVAIAPDIVEVPPQNLSRPFIIDQNQWR